MSLLASLVTAYDRLPDAPPYGFSSEKIGFCVILNADGTIAEVADLRAPDKKRTPRGVMVPQAKKRTVGIAPNFLWDKTSYVLGVTSEKDISPRPEDTPEAAVARERERNKRLSRVAEEHAAFRERHLDWLADSDDEGLSALRLFLSLWSPEQIASPLWSEDLRDQNLVFRLATEPGFLHDRPAARALWRRIGAEGASDPQTCLLTGESAPVARLHPSVKGVWGAQSSGASLVSFNLDAFTSYGHEQGDNAPVSEAATFAYTTALNLFLADKTHRLQIGDTSTVFWAEAGNTRVAEEADLWGGVMLGASSFSGDAEKTAEAQIREKLAAMRDGKPLRSIAPHLAEGVRFWVLGLAPNAARLSVRYFWQDDFSILAQNYADWLRDVALEPVADRPIFSIRAASLRSAPAERKNGKLTFDAERVSPLLSGELTRAILTGGRFPRALLGLLLLRIRSDHVLDRIRLSLIKGLILRDMRLERRLPLRPDGTVMEDYLVRPDPNDPAPARRLGRLFALIERAQASALGDGINTTVTDKFLSAACATPARLFPMLIKNARDHHIKRLRNGHSDADWITDSEHARRIAFGLERDIGLAWADLGGEVAAQHSAEEQGLFLVGYYQEKYAKRGSATPEATDTVDQED
ncbi:type I-C CRISPR-associated protein Cas8c/Csd1 [Neotabrizicola sp. VNH66]|uniref:type I-C CRISPR-associated protein Cas8c/Csd1 n=1 Tax=Neotabrizicola sp. VNH66 TaxID=3400918 RepID=UPI003BFB5A70